MSMIGGYVAITAEQLDDVLDESVEVSDLVWPEDDGVPCDVLSIDKMWHVIHFLLTGEVWGGDLPLCNAVLGGTELVGTDAGYGPFRYLTPDEVRATALGLAGLPMADLWGRFVPDEDEVAEIYGWIGDDAQFDYVSENYEPLRTFFQTAAASGKAMLLHLS